MDASVTPPGRRPEKESVTSPAAQPRPGGVRPGYRKRHVPTQQDIVFSGYAPGTVRLLLAALDVTTEKGAFARGRWSLALDSALSRDGVKDILKGLVAEGQLVRVRTGGPLRTKDGQRIPGRYVSSVYLWTWSRPDTAIDPPSRLIYPPYRGTTTNGGYVSLVGSSEGDGATILGRDLRALMLWHDAWRHPSPLGSAMLTLLTLVSDDDQEWGVQELATATGQPLATVKRHLTLLDKAGFVMRLASRGRPTRNWATDRDDWTALLEQQAERAGTVGRYAQERAAMLEQQAAADAEYEEWKRREQDADAMMAEVTIW